MNDLRRGVLITRPEAQAQAWLDAVKQHHGAAYSLPLIGIHPIAIPGLIHDHWQRLSDYALVIFVSPSAVQHFWAACFEATPAWPATTWAAAPGLGTIQALRALGVPASHVFSPDAHADQFDSEQLWRSISDKPWASKRVLVIRGHDIPPGNDTASADVVGQGHGRHWLGDRLSQAGAHIDYIAAYVRTLPQWTRAQESLFRQTLSNPDRFVWVFSSSQAVQHLAFLADQQGADSIRQPFHSAIATHPRIAQTAQTLGFQFVYPIRPVIGDLLLQLQQL